METVIVIGCAFVWIIAVFGLVGPISALCNLAHDLWYVSLPAYLSVVFYFIAYPEWVGPYLSSDMKALVEGYLWLVFAFPVGFGAIMHLVCGPSVSSESPVPSEVSTNDLTDPLT
jgi:hypothetical protein